jgi:hypothetical protein
MVVTTERGWGGGWSPVRADLDPYPIEHQAEIIVRTPIFMKLLEEIVEHGEQEPENLSDDLTQLAQIARSAKSPRKLPQGLGIPRAVL